MNRSIIHLNLHHAYKQPKYTLSCRNPEILETIILLKIAAVEGAGFVALGIWGAEFSV